MTTSETGTSTHDHREDHDPTDATPLPARVDEVLDAEALPSMDQAMSRLRTQRPIEARPVSTANYLASCIAFAATSLLI